jgi:hypothetical protein
MKVVVIVSCGLNKFIYDVQCSICDLRFFLLHIFI